MNPLTVSALTTHIVALIERDDILRDLWVTGEISNWRPAGSGHIYFNLKDSGSTIAAVMWRSAAAGQSWLPREGDQVLAHGHIGIYPDRGVYQLYVNAMQPAGRGELYARFEEMKARLEQEGLFDPERKRPLVAQPQRIAVVTSADAAALRDILRVLSVRWPLVEVILFPTLVQGAEAPPQIVAALAAANHFAETIAPIDTLILARGGGSIEDLWAFNDERVAWAVAESAIPVVAGVGHETDFTIADFTADVRAPTPSVAAAMVTPDRAEMLPRLAATQRWLEQQLATWIQQARGEVRQQQARLLRVHPQRQLDLWRQRLDERERRLHSGMTQRVRNMAAYGRVQQSRLQALSPRHVLARGYSIVQNPAGTVVRTPDQVTPGEQLSVRAAGGDYQVEVAAGSAADLSPAANTEG
ncbi:MAG: exodeoxyribonuclease VII large subunit [Litorilinea sp.]